MTKLRTFSIVLVATIGLCSSVSADEKALLKYCQADIERLCAGIEPGGGRIIECLKGKKEEMSVGCAQALKKLKGK